MAIGSRPIARSPRRARTVLLAPPWRRDVPDLLRDAIISHTQLDPQERRLQRRKLSSPELQPANQVLSGPPLQSSTHILHSNAQGLILVFRYAPVSVSSVNDTTLSKAVGKRRSPSLLMLRHRRKERWRSCMASCQMVVFIHHMHVCRRVCVSAFGHPTNGFCNCSPRLETCS